jgi:hypothetical protein
MKYCSKLSKKAGFYLAIVISIAIISYFLLNIMNERNNVAISTSLSIAAERTKFIIAGRPSISLKELEEILAADGFTISKYTEEGIEIKESPSGYILYVAGLRSRWFFQPMVAFVLPPEKTDAEEMPRKIFSSKFLQKQITR